MYSPRFCLKSFDSIRDADKITILVALVEALIAADQAFLRVNPRTPALYTSGVRYVEEPRGVDDWRDIPECLAHGNGDCEDLAAWRVAELREREGEHATPVIRRTVFPSLVLFHVLVRRSGGALEDPSVALGMKTRRAKRTAARVT